MPSAVAAKPAASQKRLGDRALRQGASGADVKELQRLLVKVGIKVEVDGQFGPSLKSAVQRFQRAVRLEASGTVGKKTVEALRRAADGTEGASYEAGGFDSRGTTRRAKTLGDRIPLRAGMSGNDVKVLQNYLRRAGVKGVSVDGEFGSGTKKGVLAFEKKVALPTDGLVDAGDIDVLRGQVEGPRTSAAKPTPLAPGDRAKLLPDGTAAAPENAPEAVKQIIAAGNRIAKKPYIYGGGHARFPEDKGYDCSGSVSYALWGAKLLKSPLVSGDFPRWGAKGPGKWVSIYGNSGHVYMVVAGLRFDTSGAKQTGSRWQTASRPTRGYGVSHPVGL